MNKISLSILIGMFSASAQAMEESRRILPFSQSYEATKLLKEAANKRLWQAAKMHDLPEAQAAIQAGADVNYVNESEGGETPLFAAVIGSRDISVIRMLLEKGADPNIKDLRGRTPLYWTASYGDLEKVEILLKAGAKVTAQDIDAAETTKFFLKESDRQSMIKMLKNQMAKQAAEVAFHIQRDAKGNIISTGVQERLPHDVVQNIINEI